MDRAAPLAGADEAGRGALAGPLVAASVVLDGETIQDLNDSKTLSVTTRERLLSSILENALAVSVVSLPAWWIDENGVGVANRRALSTVLTLLSEHWGCALADGNLKLSAEITCLPRADSRSAAVAAGSVVAKVLRDYAMTSLSVEHDGYGFQRNRGYGTLEHRKAILEIGTCRVHRLSYSGVGRPRDVGEPA